MKAFLAIIRRDLLLNMRGASGLGTAVGFILAVLVLVPLALGPDQNMLRRVAPGILWIALLLAVLLTAERIFQTDYEDGSLDVMSTGQISFEGVALAKAIGHWLSVSLPLSLIVPPLGFLLNLDIAQLIDLIMAMVLASAPLSFIAAMGGAITVGLRRGGLLVTLLVLPLYTPVLIFGIAATGGALNSAGATPSFLVLAALGLMMLVIQPFVSAAALKAFLR